MPPPDGLDQLRSQRGDVPGPHGQHHVTWFGDPRDQRSGLRPVREEQGPPAGDRVRDEPAGHAGFGVFARGVDVEDDRLVGQAKSGAEVTGEDPRPAVQVRLEDGDDPAVPGPAASGGDDPPVLPRARGGAKPSSTAAAKAAVAFSALWCPGTCTVSWAKISPNGLRPAVTVKLTPRPWDLTSPSR